MSLDKKKSSFFAENEGEKGIFDGYLFWAHKTHCPPGKDIRADFSGLSRLCELFRRLILLGNKKISSRDGMDLNYANTIWRER